MRASAISSSSPVLTPGRTAAATSRRMRPTTRPASRILSISAALFRMTPTPSALHRAPDPVVDRVGLPHPVDLGEDLPLAVELLHLRDLGAEDLEALLQLLGGVVRALHEIGALHVALALHLRGARPHVVDRPADRAAPSPGDAVHEDRLGDLQADHLVDLSAVAGERLVERPGLR